MVTASSHIETLLSLPSSFLSGILEFGLGDAEKGSGCNISDAIITRLAESCPNLVHVHLDGTRDLTDLSLLALFNNCPRLRYVQFSANDNTSGGLKGTALDALREDPKMGKDLVKLRLTDQDEFEKKKTPRDSAQGTLGTLDKEEKTFHRSGMYARVARRCVDVVGR